MDIYLEKDIHKLIEKETRYVEKAFKQELNYRILNEKKKRKRAPKPLRGSKNQ